MNDVSLRGFATKQLLVELQRRCPTIAVIRIEDGSPSLALAGNRFELHGLLKVAELLNNMEMMKGFSAPAGPALAIAHPGFDPKKEG